MSMILDKDDIKLYKHSKDVDIKDLTMENRTLNKVIKAKENLLNRSKKKSIGLCAIQLGIPENIAIIHPKRCKKPIYMANIKILKRAGGIFKSNEGCECAKRERYVVKRHRFIKVTYFDIEKGEQVTRWFGKRFGRIIQHEADHMVGVGIWNIGVLWKRRRLTNYATINSQS